MEQREQRDQQRTQERDTEDPSIQRPEEPEDEVTKDLKITLVFENRNYKKRSERKIKTRIFLNSAKKRKS